MTITEDDLAKARGSWGDGLVAIATAYEAGGFDRAKRIAEQIIDSAYAFDVGPVLFKPTLSGGEKTFRTTRKGALSYFVGNDPEYPLDAGFALWGWRQTRSETAASVIDGTCAMWMGWFFFTDKDGDVVKTDKSFGYRKHPDGGLRIVLHHSSLPFEVQTQGS